jgi:hypothetical protein
MRRVLITGGRAPVALDLARQFAAAGAQVFVADSRPFYLARASRVISRAFRVPPPRFAPQAFANAIETIIRRERIDLIVPTCEEVFYLSRFASQLLPHTKFLCPPDLHVLRMLHDKWRFSHLARDLNVHGVIVPDTWRLESRDDLARLPLPSTQLVFKPAFSRFAAYTLICPEPAALASLNPTRARPWLAQQFIAGRERCSYSIASKGQLCAHVVYEPRWRVGRGSSYYFEPVACSAIEDFTRCVVARLDYTGQIAFDFIESLDGTLAVLECNPRATSGVHLFSPADGLADAIALAAGIGGTGETARAANAGMILRPRLSQPAMVGHAMLLLGAPAVLRTGRLTQLMTDMRRARDAIWSAHDPTPSLYVFPGLISMLGTALRHRISPLAASTRDIEWDGDEIA